MRFLLDTHVVLWAWTDPNRIPQALRDELSASSNERFVSAASIWEIAIKQANRKLNLPGPAADWIPRALGRFRFVAFDMTDRHALVAGALPRIHGDPFDRMLLAQAQLEGLTLVTADPIFRQYGVPLRMI